MIKYPDEFIIGTQNAIIKNSLFRYFAREPIITLNYYYLKVRRILGKMKSTIL